MSKMLISNMYQQKICIITLLYLLFVMLKMIMSNMIKMFMSNMYQQKIVTLLPIYICYVKDDYVQHVIDAYVQCTWNDYDYVQHISTKTLYAIFTYLNGLCQRCLCLTCINEDDYVQQAFIVSNMSKMLMSNMYQQKLCIPLSPN